MKEKLLKAICVGLMIGVSALIFFVCSSLKHTLFQSTAFDLGIFDQAVYLISLGQPPVSSLLNFPIIADHAAWLLYPLGLLYKIHPDVHWLLAVQAAALALFRFAYLGFSTSGWVKRGTGSSNGSGVPPVPAGF